MRLSRALAPLLLAVVVAHPAAAHGQGAGGESPRRPIPAGELRTLPVRGGVLTLRLPADMAALPQDVVLAEFADGDSSVHVFVNPAESVLIGILPLDVDPSEAKAFMESLQEQKTEVTWITNREVEANGGRWLHLELTHRIPIARMHQHLLVAPVGAHMLVVDIAVPEHEYDAYRAAIAETIRSLRFAAPGPG